MDSIKDLSAFQGVILSADNYYSFAKLTSKGGNDEKVKYVLEKLSKFLQEKNYIGENGVVEDNVENYRKLALYLILNSDFPALEEMTEMEGLDMVIWMLPTIPTYLLSELAWGLHMRRFLYEVVAFSRPPLALQVAEALVAHLRHLRPAAAPPRARLVAAALHRLLLRLPFSACADAALRAAALACFRSCLETFVDPPNAHALLALPRDDQYRHLGVSLDLALGLLEECLGRFSAREEVQAEGFADVYRATHGLAAGSPAAAARDAALQQCLQECHAGLLDTCAALVMNVSVDVFCAWSEFEQDGASVQRSIGERCHRVRRLVLATPSAAEHPLAGMLRQLAREPPPLAAAAAAADAAELLARAAGAGAEPAAWRAALLKRDDLCRHPSLLGLLESHLHEFDEEQNFEFFKKITDHLGDERENGEYLKALAVKAFHRCGVAVKYTIIDERFRESLDDDMESAGFGDALTDTFNRLTAARGADPTDVLTAFFQNPERVLVKIFRAAAESARQAAIMLDVMDGLKRFRDRRYRRDAEPAVIKVANHAFENFLDTERKRDNLVGFMIGLKERDVIPENELLVLVVMPRVHAALLARGAAALGAAAALLAALGARALRPHRAPALALLAQLMDALRAPRRAAEFPAERPRALALACALQRDLMRTYGDDPIPEPELGWLRRRVQRAHPLTRPYFARVLPAPPPRAAALLQALGSLTAEEWESWVGAEWRGAALLGAPAAALRRLPAAARPHALGCYVALLRKKYMDDPPTDEQLLSCVRAAAGAAEGAPAELAGALAAVLLPLAAPLRARAAATRAAAAAAAPSLAAALAAPAAPQ